MIRAAAPSDFDAIALLSARRHARLKGAFPDLSAQFTDPAMVRAALPPEPQGWVDEADDGRLRASLLWEANDDRVVAGIVGTVGSPEAMARVYAVAGEEWLAAGVATHGFVVPSTDRPLADRLVDLTFGREEAYAIRSLGDRGGTKVTGQVEVERTGMERLDEVIRLGNLLARHHEGAPVFDRHSNEFFTGMADTYREAIDKHDVRVLLARVDDGAAVGVLLWRPGAPFPIYDDRSAEMVLLAVDPAARGRKVGRTLVSAALRDMASFGHSAAIADWRTTNLEASRFWPSQGFLTVAHRYMRTVPERRMVG